MSVRAATAADVVRMAELSALKRSQYAAYSPIFWRPDANGSESQQTFFTTLIADSSSICLVHEVAEHVDGFIIARVVSAPPVYDPGGKVCMIDDYMVADPSLWASVGKVLLENAEQVASKLGAIISVTVCGERDAPKREHLRQTGACVSSEWYVHEIKAQNEN